MFDNKTLPRNPGIARRLLTFGQMNGMTFDEKLVELASEDLITHDDLKEAPFNLTTQGLYALQHIRDWNSRAVILGIGPDRAREVALTNVWMRGGQTLILAQPSCYAEWASLIKMAWPEAKISVFGNPRYHDKNLSYPHGVNFSDKPDLDADFFVSSYGGVIWHDLCGHVTVNQTIVEELDHQSAINYRWEEAVRGLVSELPHPVFIQNIFNLPSDHGRDNLASLQMHSSRAFSFMFDLISEYLWAGLDIALPFKGSIREIEDYLAARSYQGYDIFKLLTIFGVSTHLLDEMNGFMPPLVFRDLTIQQLKVSKSSKRSGSGLYRLVERERDLAAQQGQSMSVITRAALDGNDTALTLVGDLMTTQWSNLKANHVKVTHGAMTTRFSKSLILVHNHDLKRGLKLHFGAAIDDLTSDPETSKERFIQEQSRWTIYAGLKPLASLIVTLDELQNNPKLLDVANFLFVPEWKTTEEEYGSLKELADQHGTRLVLTILDSTFEERVYQHLH